jgi:putative ABC transport system ATP-binding protein
MENATPPLVVIKDLIKSYHRGSQIIPVLNNISLSIAEGEFLALMGPSGSGKSTLLNLIAGLDKPDSGSIVIGEVDITLLTEAELARWRAASVGFIFQFYNLIPVLTAFENIELPLLLTSLSRRERKEHTEMALEVVNLTDRHRAGPDDSRGR